MKRNPYSQISFALGFDKDTVSLTINDTPILQNLLFTSKHENCGQTDYKILIKSEGNKLIVGINNYVEKTWSFVVVEKKANKILEMQFKINQTLFNFEVDLKRGRYVNFYMNDSITYHQNITLVGCD